MRILLLGPQGQVGWELQRSLQPLGKVITLGRREETLCGDLTQPIELAATVRALQPEVIVNAAAYTAVDKAESEPDLARAINVLGPETLALEAARLGAWLVHYSTDYVFDGSGTHLWKEDSPAAPLSVYGKTKWDGEQAVRASGCKHLVFRTSWVHSARGTNFARMILRLAKEREALTVVEDQIGAPTGADLIADVTALALKAATHDPLKAGTYHLAAAGHSSWLDYARHVITWARKHGQPIKLDADKAFGISSEKYPAAARRPLNSRLDTTKLRQTFDIHLPPWQFGVDRMLHEATAS